MCWTVKVKALQNPGCVYQEMGLAESKTVESNKMLEITRTK